MKIKVKPEDFIVEEVASLPLAAKGEYGLYQLTKRNWNTVDLLYRIVSRLHIPFTAIGYGGKKDRYGETTQFITIKNNKKISLSDKDWSLQHLGRMGRAMGSDLIDGNKFNVTVRDLSPKESEKAFAALELVKKYGLPNYFDDQRFGSYDRKNGLIAEKILLKHYNGALKLYLTSIYPEDQKEEKERKRSFLANWGAWDKCLTQAKTIYEKATFKLLAAKPKELLRPLQEIPKEEMSMFFSAYQSFIWSEILRRLLGAINEPLIKVPGKAGDYLFYGELSSQNLNYLSKLLIPTVSSRVVIANPLTGRIFDEVLNERGVKLPLFNIREIRQSFFKSFDRPAIIYPADLSVAAAADEIYAGKQKLQLKFFLKRGAYATMVIKRLFAA